MKKAIIILSAGLALMAQAQSWLDYDQALSRWTWLRTLNAAALTTYVPVDSSQHLLADAQLTMATERGHLAQPGASPGIWQASAAVRSIYRVGHRVVLRGGMNYRNRWGDDAGGSVWLNPDAMPFDITEYTDSTRGKMRVEQYGLNGEVGVTIAPGLDLGARFAYIAANSTKQKDPRHTNSVMQLEASAGAAWRWRGATLGANYLLRRNTEAVQLRTYGRTDRVYHYLVNYGAFYGRDEQTDGKGYVSADSEHPLLDMCHGLALQGGYEHGSWSAVAQWSWTHRHGHYGLESPSMVDFNRHQGDRWEATLWLQHAQPQAIYRLEIAWNHENLRDYERTYRTITQGGVTDVVYYDNRLMGRRQAIDYRITATAQWNIHRHLAAWQIEAGVRHHRGEVTAIVYPYFRSQNTRLTTVEASMRRNWLCTRDHTWTLMAGLRWAGGGGNPKSDSTYGTPSEGSQAPVEHDEYLMQQYEWLTAGRFAASAGVRWSMPLAAGRCRLYAEARGLLCWGHDIHHLADAHRHEASVSLGCLF